MVNKIILLFFLLVIGVSCQKIYYFPDVENIDVDLYTLPVPIPSQNSLLTDSSSFYLQVFGENANYMEKENPSILKFHKDGFFEKRSKRFYHDFEWRDKRSIGYGGRYAVYENGKIRIEKFYPSGQGQTHRFIKEISEGIVKGDTIVLNVFNSEMKYIRTTYDEVFR